MSERKWTTVRKNSRGGCGKLPGGGSNGVSQGGNRHGGGYYRRRGGHGKIYQLTLQEGSVNGRRGLVGTVGGKRVEVWKPKYILHGLENLDIKQVTIPAREIVTRTGSFFKPIFLGGVPPGFRGHAHFFTSMNRGSSYTAMLKDHRGRLQLAYVVRGQFQSKWTPVPARQTLPTRPTRKDSQETKKLGIATSNSFATLLESEKIVKPKQKIVKPKQKHFPQLGNNPATSTCNLAWGGNTRTLVKQVEDAKRAALVKRIEKAKVAKQTALAEKKVKTPVFVPIVRKLNVGLPGDDSDEDDSNEDDSNKDVSDEDDGWGRSKNPRKYPLYGTWESDDRYDDDGGW